MYPFVQVLSRLYLNSSILIQAQAYNSVVMNIVNHILIFTIA